MNTRTFFLLVAILRVFVAGAVDYTPEQIPNVQRTDSTQYVSNPDGILSPASVAQINATLRNVRHLSTAEVAVVAVDNISGGDIDRFATDLFELWGLGKSDKDNGLLVLVVKDLRRAAIRPGYGLEGVLPDITCGRIIREVMAPDFARGQYDAGMVASVDAISSILTTPEAIEEIRSGEGDYNAARADSEGEEIFHAYLVLCIVAACALLIWFLLMLRQNRGRDRHAKYEAMARYLPIFLVVSFLCMSIPLPVAIVFLILLKHWRNSPRICKACGKKMVKLDEVTDNKYLNPGQDLEERLGSVDYDVWLCPDCGETDIEPYVNNSSSYKECPRCGVRAYALRRQRILRQPTTGQEGLGVNEYHCDACGYDHDDNFQIPRRQDNSAAIAGAVLGAAAASRGGFGGGGFSGGGFGGGGFGGGSTGGGGASGGW